MIISHKHKYLFVELPLTGSTAIADELLSMYDGERILMKHSTYEDFRRATGDRYRDYFVFGGIRHPLDQLASRYAKTKVDHRGKFSHLSPQRRARGLHFLAHWWIENRRYRFVTRGTAGFGEYFKRYYHLPYSNWSIISHKQFNAVIRFESLIEDFENVLRRLKIAPRRELPVRNQSEGKGNWQGYFDTPIIRGRAVRIFGPFMEYWNYEFPPNWGNCSISRWSRILYAVTNVGRKFYWRWLRYKI